MIRSNVENLHELYSRKVSIEIELGKLRALLSEIKKQIPLSSPVELAKLTVSESETGIKIKDLENEFDTLSSKIIEEEQIIIKTLKSKDGTQAQVGSTDVIVSAMSLTAQITAQYNILNQKLDSLGSLAETVTSLEKRFIEIESNHIPTIEKKIKRIERNAYMLDKDVTIPVLASSIIFFIMVFCWLWMQIRNWIIANVHYTFPLALVLTTIIAILLTTSRSNYQDKLRN